MELYKRSLQALIALHQRTGNAVELVEDANRAAALLACGRLTAAEFESVTAAAEGAAVIP